jgi:hypothetical protein
MAYDTELADRIRFLIGTWPGVTEKKMFGALAFLVGGNMAISASSQGGALVRVDPADTDALIAAANPSSDGGPHNARMAARQVRGSGNRRTAHRLGEPGRRLCPVASA